jgi:hypothetical protein
VSGTRKRPVDEVPSQGSSSQARAGTTSIVEAQEDYDEDAQAATATIFPYCGITAKGHIRNIRDPVLVWKKLKDVYEHRGFSARFLLWRQLFTVKFNGDMDQYINSITSIRQKLSDASYSIPNEVISSLLLTGLDSTWDNFIAAATQSYRQMGKDEVDPDDLISQLLDENRRKAASTLANTTQPAEDLEGEPAQASAHLAHRRNRDQRQKRPRPECSYCKRTGHTEDECWDKEDDEKEGKPKRRRQHGSANLAIAEPTRYPSPIYGDPC